jgi:hypothetical protein
MEHFPNSRWVDLVRGFETDATSAEMRSHVQSGCPECRDGYRIWEALVSFTERDRAADPPEDVLRVAKAYMATHTFAASIAEQPESSWTTTLATLTFDSLRQALPAGVRAGGSLARHLMYEANAFIVDLQLNSDTRSGQIVLAGQIVATTSPAFPEEKLVVSVAGAGRELATVYPNKFGEFEYEFDCGRDNLMLTVAMSDGAKILIPVDLTPSTKDNTLIEE